MKNLIRALPLAVACLSAPAHATDSGPNAVSTTSGFLYSTLPSSLGSTTGVVISFWYKVTDPARLQTQSAFLLGVGGYLYSPNVINYPTMGIFMDPIFGKKNSWKGDAIFIEGEPNPYNGPYYSSRFAYPGGITIPVTDTLWHNLRISINLPSEMQVCIDTEACLSFSPNPVDWGYTGPGMTTLQWGGVVASLPAPYSTYSDPTYGSEAWGGSISEVYINPTNSAPSVAMTGGIGSSFLYTSGGANYAQDLGTQGFAPMGETPAVYLSGDAMTFPNNYNGDSRPAMIGGTFPDSFSVTGTLNDDTDDPFQPGSQ